MGSCCGLPDNDNVDRPKTTTEAAAGKDDQQKQPPLVLPATTLADEADEMYLGETESGRPVHGRPVTKGDETFITNVRHGSFFAKGGEHHQEEARVHEPKIPIPYPYPTFLDEIRENVLETDSNKSSHGEMGFFPR